LGVQHNGHSGGVRTSPEYFKPRAGTATRASEAALLAAKSATAAFRTLRLVERTAAAAASVVPVVAALVAVAIVVPAIVLFRHRLGRRTTIVPAAAAKVASASGIAASAAILVEVSPLTRWARAVFRDVEAQWAPTDRSPVELLHCLLRVVFFGEPDEREAPRATRFAVLGNVNVNDLADFTEDFAKLFVGRGKVEVPYEYLV
jgi:hypothetical protein